METRNFGNSAAACTFKPSKSEDEYQKLGVDADLVVRALVGIKRGLFLELLPKDNKKLGSSPCPPSMP